jgi:large subunit ribosomal protein L29
MKIKEMRDLTRDELNGKIKEFRSRLFDIRFKTAIHEVENTSEIATIRHQIAQAKTVIREKELAAEYELH